MTKCPKCDLQWEPPCDQTACIELFGECISCRRFKLTEDEIKQIQTSAALERKAENARELGLDYAPLEAKDEPVLYGCKFIKGNRIDAFNSKSRAESYVKGALKNGADVSLIALYTNPLQQEAKDEPVACVQDLDEVKRKHLVYEKGMNWKDPLYTTPPPCPTCEALSRTVMMDQTGRDA